jgi:hypothetical protein
LLLNGRGRPLEFHCTTPLRPNRAQQILYGPTLEPFLYGEQIGQTLLLKSRHEVLVVCTDQVPALAVREHCEMPVALVRTPAHPTTPTTAPAVTADAGDWAIGGGMSGVSPLLCFRLGGNELAIARDTAGDQRLIIEALANLGVSFDLAEPFQRIREAIEEAQRAARAAA